MKKNITINLFGQLYAIDEDACNLLEQYLDNMKRYFARREGGDEIADDIEHRVAELFSVLKSDGVEAISVEHVRDIIRRVGNPEEMDNEELSGNGGTADTKPDNEDAPHGETATPPPAGEKSSERCRRRLYRDPQDRMLGGVMSGLCHYFGANDPLPWRIIMVILAFFSLNVAGILYLVAWALVPQAVTAEQRLQMCGKPVNPQTLSEEVMRGAQRGVSYLGSSEFQSDARGCLGTLLSLLVFLLKIGCLFFVGICLVVMLAFTALLVFGTFGGAATLVSYGIFDADSIGVLQQFHGITPMLWGIAISTLICGGIVIYALVRSFIRRPGDRALSAGTRVALTVIAVLCGATAITLTTLSAIAVEHAESVRYRKENTRNGVYLDKYQRERLESEGWQVKSLLNCDEDGHIWESTKSLTDEDGRCDYMLFEREDGRKNMRVHLERTEERAAGVYHLEAIGFSKGTGAYVFARTDSGNVVAASFPVDDTSGHGNMRNLADSVLGGIDYLKNGSARHVSIRLPGVSIDVDDDSASVNGADVSVSRGRVKGWSFVRSGSFYHKGGPVVLGTTNIPGVVGKEGSASGPYKYGLLDIRLVSDGAGSVVK